MLPRALAPNGKCTRGLGVQLNAMRSNETAPETLPTQPNQFILRGNRLCRKGSVTGVFQMGIADAAARICHREKRDEAAPRHKPDLKSSQFMARAPCAPLIPSVHPRRARRRQAAV